MKNIIIILLTRSLLISTSLYSQISYNKQDSTYIIQYRDLLNIQKKIIGCKDERNMLEREISLLEDITDQQNNKIDKLLLRDSLYRKEIQLYSEMDETLREKLNRSSDIINNYKSLVLITEEELKLEVKQRKKATFWKNVHKYSNVVLGSGLLILYLVK
jgi:D-ribose pyranose/furanose isomerase RbsD